ncbi:MAG: galactokinase [Anaerolineales bacterium]|nr:galactokinase [Anaerolineales bacterium]
MDDLHSQVITAFTEQYGEPPAVVVRAPGRVNLIGEHTDYNDGFVMPLAIDRAFWLALRPRQDNHVSVRSLNVNETALFTLTGLHKGSESWVEYVKGVAWALQESGHTLNGFEGVLVSDVPMGAGLSSSAALELAIARAFAEVSRLDWDPAEMALLAQKAENQWVGMNCGIMDQMISAAGQAGHALFIDCRDLSSESVPLPKGTAVVILDTATRRGLVDSAYNERRAQCEAAAKFFGVPALRDVSVADLEARGEALETLNPLIYRRAKHVITENERVQQAKNALRAGDAERAGQLMDASHVSLRDDFQVSSEALDTMVWLARQQDGCWGARMTGAGFGGCAVALVQADKAAKFAAQVTKMYKRQMDLDPAVYICQPTDGAAVVR